MEEEGWSQSEPTPVAQHFAGKGELHNPPPGEWQAFPSSKLNVCSERTS
jgi:hypothetical protein